ncbi:hypothetical protein B0J12DRAFT_25361 [Macrophomina phaseolina]|uniref:Uncharacterized protein n=1 Tax=Macrophomina phaseolina TaxID=35725 RepID=A0ABQ8GVK2_9PEZI|nr:hypothetical protein B0J12DRAFT_25361 [Macrophomina phaseolina]
MDAPPSYVQCSLHPGAESCLEHALNQEPNVVLESERMIACLRTFLSRCTHAQLAKLLGTPQRNLRPLAPKQIVPPSPSRAEDDPNAGSGPIQRFPLLAPPQPQPLPPTKTPPPQTRAPKKPPPQTKVPKKPPTQAPAPSKRKRASRTPVEISSGSDSDSSASLSDTGSDTERASQRRKKNPPSDLNLVTSAKNNAHFSGFRTERIDAALASFLPVQSCEKFLLPSLHDLGLSLAENHQPSQTESRLEKHIRTIKSFVSDSRTMTVYDRINILLLHFEVDMFQSDKKAKLTRGSTRQAFAISKVAQVWGASESWIKWQLHRAMKFMMLIEDHPSYLTDLECKSESKWVRLSDAESRAILSYFGRDERRQSSNRQERDLLVCKRIIECLRRVDWTFSEIVGGESSILKILRKHINFDALAEGHVRPLSPLKGAPNQGNSPSRNGDLSLGTSCSPLPTTGQQENTGLSPARPEAQSETYPSHEELQHYGWGDTLNLNLFSMGGDDDIFPFGLEGNQSISWEDQIQDIFSFGLEGNQSISWEDRIQW